MDADNKEIRVSGIEEEEEASHLLASEPSSKNGYSFGAVHPPDNTANTESPSISPHLIDSMPVPVKLAPHYEDSDDDVTNLAIKSKKRLLLRPTRRAAKDLESDESDEERAVAPADAVTNDNQEESSKGGREPHATEVNENDEDDEDLKTYKETQRTLLSSKRQKLRDKAPLEEQTESEEEMEPSGESLVSEDSEEDSEESEIEGGNALDGFIVDEPEASNKDSSEDDEEEEEEDEGNLDDDDIALIAENTGYIVPSQFDEEAEKPHRRLKKLDRSVNEGMIDTALAEGEKIDFMEDSSRYSEALQMIYQCFGDVVTVTKILRNERPLDTDLSRGLDEEEPGEIRKVVKPQSWAELGEPEEVKREYLTTTDELICAKDMPERLYLRYQNRPVVTADEEIKMEASWLAMQLENEFSDELTESKILKSYDAVFGKSYELPAGKSMSIDIEEKCAEVLRYILNDKFEVPFILYHKRHFVCPPLTDDMIWRIYELDIEWCRLAELLHTIERQVRTLEQNGIAFSDLHPMVQYMKTKWQTEEDLTDMHAFLSLHYRHVLRKVRPTSSQVQSEEMSNAIIPYREERNLNTLKAISDSSAKRNEESSEEDKKLVEVDMEISQLFGDSENIEKETQLPVYRGTDEMDASPKKQNGSPMKSHVIGGIGFIELVEQYELASTWEKYLLTAEEFGVNLHDTAKGQECTRFIKTPCPAIPCSEEAMIEHEAEEWCEKMVNGPFDTGRKVLDVLIKFFAKIYSADPLLRSKLRELYRQECCVTTWTTALGEQKLDVGRSDWMTYRLLRVPPEMMLRATSTNEYNESSNHDSYDGSTTLQDIFLNAYRLEQKGLLKIVISPVPSSETTPWNTPEFETRCKEWNRKLKGITNIEDEKVGYVEETALTFDIQKQYSESDAKDATWLENIMQMMTRAFCYVNNGRAPNVWISVQKLILKRVLEVELIPLFRQEVREFLIRNGYEYVIAECQKKLEQRLMMMPVNTVEEEAGAGEPVNVKPEIKCDASEDSLFNLGGNENETRSPRKNLTESRLTLQKQRSNTIEDDDEYDENEPSKRKAVFSLLIEELGNTIRTHGALIDEFGEFEKNYVFDSLMIYEPREFTLDEKTSSSGTPHEEAKLKQEYYNLAKLLQELNPAIVAVGVSHLQSIELHRRLSNRVFPLMARMLQNNEEAQESKNDKLPLLELAGLEVARLWANSDKCPTSLSNHFPKEVLMCISIGRLLQDPLSEILNLWNPQGQNYLLKLRYHPLQECVPREKFEQALEIVAMKVVARVGVDLNRIRFHPHLMSTLQFVAGLGPRRAQDIFNKILGRDKFLLRSQLSSAVEMDDEDLDKEGADGNDNSKKFGPCVFQNCASFLRVIIPDADEMIDVLDNSRIHPLDGATLATKMCKDAMDDDEGIDPKEDCVGAVFKNPSALDTLDLERFAIVLDQSGQPRMLPYLVFIKNELTSPFMEQRRKYQPPSDKDIFYWAVNEQPQDFKVGTEVICYVTAGEKNYIRAVTKPHGFPVIIRDKNGLQDDMLSKLNVLFVDFASLIGKLFFGRIFQLHFDRRSNWNYPFYRIDVVVTRQSIRQLIFKLLDTHTNAPVPEQFVSLSYIHDVFGSLRSLPYESESSYQQKHRIRRKIHHANYKSFSPQVAIKYFKHDYISVGECIFRPSKSIDKLVLMVKTCSEPFNVASFIIEEKGQRTAGDLGKELWLNGKQYEDLDQIIDQFVDGLKNNLEEVYRHPKYNKKGVEKVTALLHEHVLKNRDSIAWAICPPPEMSEHESQSAEAALRFTLVVVPPLIAHATKNAATYLADHIYITHQKFKLWTYAADSLQQLIEWWKCSGYWRRSAEIAEYKKYVESIKAARKEENDSRKQHPAQAQHTSADAHSGGVPGFMQKRIQSTTNGSNRELMGNSRRGRNFMDSRSQSRSMGRSREMFLSRSVDPRNVGQTGEGRRHDFARPSVGRFHMNGYGDKGNTDETALSHSYRSEVRTKDAETTKAEEAQAPPVEEGLSVIDF